MIGAVSGSILLRYFLRTILCRPNVVGRTTTSLVMTSPISSHSSGRAFTSLGIRIVSLITGRLASLASMLRRFLPLRLVVLVGIVGSASVSACAVSSSSNRMDSVCWISRYCWRASSALPGLACTISNAWIFRRRFAFSPSSSYTLPLREVFSMCSLFSLIVMTLTRLAYMSVVNSSMI